MSAVAELDLDAETRTSMLNTASGETIRASGELAAILALTACALDDSEPALCDVTAALATAADTVRLHGIEVDVGESDASMAHVNGARVEAVLPALLRVVAGASKAVDVRVVPDGDRLHVRVSRAKPELDTEPLPPVAANLVDELGARPEEHDGVAFSWAMSS